MFDIDTFRALCHKAAIEKEPAKLEKIEDELRFLLRTEEIQVCPVRWKPAQKPN